MRLLLDTQVLLWQLSGERTLSEPAVSAVAGATDLVVSAVSYAEIGIKVAVGKLVAPADIGDRVAGLGVRTLALSAAHRLTVAELPFHHRDPFDRLLIAQARYESLTVVTGDPRFDAYDVVTVRA